MANLLAVNEASFEAEVLKADVLVLVDFWAEWCNPCRMLTPILEEIATHYEDKLKVVKVNVDENRSISTQYGIRSIPTLLLFKAGQSLATKVGALSKSQLISFIDSHL